MSAFNVRAGDHAPTCTTKWSFCAATYHTWLDLTELQENSFLSSITFLPRSARLAQQILLFAIVPHQASIHHKRRTGDVCGII